MQRRVDPEDGRAHTLEEMMLKYKGTYTRSEIESYFSSECQLADDAKQLPATADQASGEIKGLRQWLREVGYEHCMERVAHWCDENGAVLLEEVQENWEEVVGELKLEKTASPCVNQGDEATLQVPGLSEWLEEVELEEYLEDVLEWCQEHGVRALKEIQAKWEDILQDLKLKTAKEQLPGKRVSVRVLKGKWQGSYMAQVLDVTGTGIQIRHLEDDYEETLPLDALGGGKYLLEPVDSDDEEATGDVRELLRTGQLRVDATGAGLQLRWVKLGYAVDKVERQPGQQDLRQGDVVLAVGGSPLTGLDEDTVEERFSTAFGDGASLVIGCLSELMKHPIEQVAAEVKRLA